MDRQQQPHRLVNICEWISICLLIVAVLVGMLLGSGASATGRAVFQLVSCLCVVTGGLVMVLEGRLRFLRSPLLFVLAALPLLALLQVLPGPWGDWSPLSWASPASAIVSANRHATFHWLLWSVGLLGLLWASAHLLRSCRQVTTVVTILALGLGLAGIFGIATRSHATGKPLGAFRLDDANTPVAIRDAFRPDSAIGAARIAPVAEIEEQSGPSLWYHRQASAPLFGGFLHIAHWSACTLAVLPVLFIIALRKLRRPAHSAMEREWLGLPPFAQGVCLWLFAFGLTFILAWWSDPVNSAIAVAVSFVLMLALCHSNDRTFLFATGFLQLGMVLALSVTRISLDGGFYWLSDRCRQLLADNVCLARAFLDHFWLGCGLGAIAEVWPLYRQDPASVPSQASSLLVFLVESGLIGGALVLAGTAYVMGRWCSIRDALAVEDRRILAAILAGLSSVLAFAFMGPGLETPVVVALFIVLIGCTARGLAGGFSPAQVGGIHG